jgi:hypothetical protein
MKRPASQNPRLHAGSSSAGYRRGVVIGDGGHRYRQPWRPRAPSTPPCERCGETIAEYLVPDRQAGWERPRRVCGMCCDIVTGRLPQGCRRAR